MGVAGLNWNAKILPVRVLGKCGGAEDDVIDAMRWAAGLSVSGVPVNVHPAKVLNLSLAAALPTPPDTCDTAFQAAIDDVSAAGAIVVASSGNYQYDLDTSPLIPATCSGVIDVGAIGLTGGRAFYSDYGAAVAISAPGGDENHGLSYGIYSTLNDGTQGPGNDSYDYQMGTSEAAPQVSGVASLLLSLDPALTQAQVPPHSVAILPVPPPPAARVFWMPARPSATC